MNFRVRIGIDDLPVPIHAGFQQESLLNHFDDCVNSPYEDGPEGEDDLE